MAYFRVLSRLYPRTEDNHWKSYSETRTELLASRRRSSGGRKIIDTIVTFGDRHLN
jgi:hypothetical protein